MKGLWTRELQTEEIKALTQTRKTLLSIPSPQVPGAGSISNGGAMAVPAAKQAEEDQPVTGVTGCLHLVQCF